MKLTQSEEFWAHVIATAIVFGIVGFALGVLVGHTIMVNNW